MSKKRTSLVSRLRQDIADMQQHFQFYRCGGCKRLAPSGYICPYCLKDPTR